MVVPNAGVHFSYLMTPAEIARKYGWFAHTELDNVRARAPHYLRAMTRLGVSAVSHEVLHRIPLEEADPVQRALFEHHPEFFDLGSPAPSMLRKVASGWSRRRAHRRVPDLLARAGDSVLDASAGLFRRGDHHGWDGVAQSRKGDDIPALAAPATVVDHPSDAAAAVEPAFQIIRDRLSPGTRVLDIGCGLGNVGRFLSMSGAEVDGIEPDPARAAVAREVLHHVWTCRLEDASVEGLGRYDVVTVLDVIEHFASPVEALARTRKFMAPNARLFLFVPNSAHWSFRLKMLRGDWSYHDWGLFDRTHLRFFDPSTATELCREAGFKELGRWYTSPGSGRHGRIGRCLAPAIYALHILFELQDQHASVSNASTSGRP